jgi:xylulokinase
MTAYLGIDIGTSATKTLAIDAQGNILAESTWAYPSSHPKPTWSEQNPEDWWTATINTTRAVIKHANLKPQDVKAIGLSGQMHGAVFLDKTSCVIRPAILWNDQRTTQECDEIESKAGGKEALMKLVANPALTGFTAPKMLWLRKHEPKNFEKTHKVLLPKDEIRRRLTGEFATDVSDAGGMLLLDVANRRWSKQLLGLLDLDESLLAPCFESVEITGRLSAHAAELLGLTTDCVVVGGAGDCPAAAIGCGVVKSGTLSTSIGTSSVMMVHSDDYKVDPLGRIHTMCGCVPGKWFMMGVNLSGGGCLQWFRNQLCKMEVSQLSQGNFYETLSEEAQIIPAGSDGLFFLPYLSGERTPHNDADARGCFIGLSLAHTRGHMVRAVMEGVAYNMTDSLQIIRALGIPVDEIRASGGGSQSQVWRQIQADAFGQSVVTLNAEQGPAYGVALLAATGKGAFSSVEEACNATIRVVFETKTNNDNVAYYAHGFPIFQNLYRSLKAEFKAIAALEKKSDLVKTSR